MDKIFYFSLFELLWSLHSYNIHWLFSYLLFKLNFLIICHLVTDIIRKQTSSNSLSRFRICFSCVYIRWKKNTKKTINIYCRNIYVKSQLRNAGLMCVADALWPHPSLLGTHSSDSLLLQAPVTFCLEAFFGYKNILSLWARVKAECKQFNAPMSSIQSVDGWSWWMESHFGWNNLEACHSGIELQ